MELLTRSGTNNLHGALFEFVRNNDLDARNYFRPVPLSKDTLQRNQFGFVLSGPVWIPKVYDGKNQTFWMVNFEGQREKSEVAQNASVIPVPFRTGNFSALSTPLKDPLGGVFPGNIIPANRLDPIAQNYLQYEVLPNVPGRASIWPASKKISTISTRFSRASITIQRSRPPVFQGCSFRL